MSVTVFRMDAGERTEARRIADLLLQGSGKPVRVSVEGPDGARVEVELPPEVRGILQLGVRCLGDEGEVGLASGRALVRG